MTLRDRVHEIYARHPHHILPYVGSAFTEPAASRLRVMAVGINAYVSEPDWAAARPEWFAGWFEHRSHRFQRSVCSSVDELGQALTSAGRIFEGREFAMPHSLYATNAVKVFVPEAEGKRADQLEDAAFERHVDQWREELRALGTHDALPHVIVIFGESFWERAWRTFHPKTGGTFDVARYETADGDAFHHANRITLRVRDGEHDLLLVRLRHPSGRSVNGSARWLLEQPGFARLVRP